MYSCHSLSISWNAAWEFVSLLITCTESVLILCCLELIYKLQQLPFSHRWAPCPDLSRAASPPCLRGKSRSHPLLPWTVRPRWCMSSSPGHRDQCCNMLRCHIQNVHIPEKHQYSHMDSCFELDSLSQFIVEKLFVFLPLLSTAWGPRCSWCGSARRSSSRPSSSSRPRAGYAEATSPA